VYGLLGIVANIALFFYIILLFALMKLPLFFFSDQYIVLTLAGIAGIILSTGMAIDANILIFERLKEEIRKGKFLKTAIEISFKRSWSAIWDRPPYLSPGNNGVPPFQMPIMTSGKKPSLSIIRTSFRERSKS